MCTSVLCDTGIWCSGLRNADGSREPTWKGWVMIISESNNNSHVKEEVGRKWNQVWDAEETKRLKSGHCNERIQGHRQWIFFYYVEKRNACGRNEHKFCVPFLGAFETLRKATIRFVMSVRMKQSVFHWKDFRKML